MHHILGNKVLEYDVDDRGVIVDEREIDRTVNHKPNIADWVKEHMVFWYDVQKQGATNEILKANPYLQDHSGNNRPLKLNNFLFAAMSGVGGYELNWTDQSIWARFLGSRFNGAIEPHKLTVTSALGSYNIMETKVPSYAKKFKVRIDGIVDETVAYKYINASGTLVSFDIKEDGEYELPSNNTIEGNFNMGWAILVNSYPHTCNITIEQIPSYPNALVTDGVDDYGQIQNLQHGVKVLFVTINPFIDGKFIYDQRLNNIEP